MSDTFDLRPAVPADHAAILRIAVAADLFAPDELTVFDAEIRSGFDAPQPGKAWIVAEDAAMLGAALLVPEGMTGEHRNLLFLGVAPASRRRGVGRRLVAHAEALARSDGARLLLIETADGPEMAPVRALYARLGYAIDGTIRDYWAPGVGKVIFRKTL